jgi:hypothetical protein
MDALQSAVYSLSSPRDNFEFSAPLSSFDASSSSDSDGSVIESDTEVFLGGLFYSETESHAAEIVSVCTLSHEDSSFTPMGGGIKTTGLLVSIVEDPSQSVRTLRSRDTVSFRFFSLRDIVVDFLVNYGTSVALD